MDLDHGDQATPNPTFAEALVEGGGKPHPQPVAETQPERENSVPTDLTLTVFMTQHNKQPLPLALLTDFKKAYTTYVNGKMDESRMHQLRNWLNQ